MRYTVHKTHQKDEVTQQGGKLDKHTHNALTQIATVSALCILCVSAAFCLPSCVFFSLSFSPQGNRKAALTTNQKADRGVLIDFCLPLSFSSIQLPPLFNLSFPFSPSPHFAIGRRLAYMCVQTWAGWMSGVRNRNRERWRKKKEETKKKGTRHSPTSSAQRVEGPRQRIGSMIAIYCVARVQMIIRFKGKLTTETHQNANKETMSKSSFFFQLLLF